MSWQTMGLRTKLITATVVTVALGFSVTLGIVTYKSYTATYAQGEALAQAEALDAAAKVRLRLDSAMSVAHSLALALEGLHGAGDHSRTAINALLLHSLKGRPEVLGIYTGWEPNAFDGDDARHVGKEGHDSTGRFVPYWHRGNGQPALEPLVDYTKEGAGDYYILAQRSSKPQLIDPYFYALSGKQVLITSLVQPILKDGRFQGIAGVDIALDALQKELAAIRPLQAGHVALYSASGLVVSHPDAAQLGKPASLPAEAISALKDGRSLRWSDEQGQVNFLEPTRIDGPDKSWATVVSVPTSAIVGSAESLRATAILLGLVSAGLITAVLFGLLTALTRPLTQLSRAMSELSSGDADLTRRVPIDRADELGRTAASLNAFLDRLQSMFRDVRDESQALAKGLRAVNRSTEQVAMSSRTVADTTSENAATIEEITVSSGHIADHAREADEAMLTTREQSRRSAAAVNAMEAQMRNIGATIERLAGSLGELSARSQQVAGVVQVIREVADQTNLLALNAAIEAARAGEQGRGFAVVADEVRKLAERTTSSVQEISSVISTIQHGAAGAVSSMQSSRTLVSEVVLAASTASESMTGICHSASTMQGAIDNISDALREQRGASTELARNVEAIAQMSEENSAAVGSVASTAHRLLTVADSLKSSVSRFRV
ncbi:MAG TPA: methyl-accepting chemotaxis protein [Zoogloea sp.]|nr:methyl-accepting chemotaxis protein [Zoogloea sp.]